MKTILIALTLLASLPLVEPQIQWSATKFGCEVAFGSFADREVPVAFAAVRCDPKRVEINIVDTSGALGKNNRYAAFSLREVLAATHSSVAVNAGSTSSFSVPAPAGLLLIHGRLVSRPRPRADGAGVLCIAGVQVRIEELSSSVQESCSDAVQRGPILSQDFVNNAQSRYRRTVAAVDSQGRFLLVVTKQPTTLSAVHSFLYHSTADLGVRSALNLDGDSSSGLIFGEDEGVKEVVTGTVDGLVASAITIRRRR